MDENEKKAVERAIIDRLLNTPDDYYISDTGKVLYALLAGVYLWSLPATEGTNFHLMTSADIATLIHVHLKTKFG